MGTAIVRASVGEQVSSRIVAAVASPAASPPGSTSVKSPASAPLGVRVVDELPPDLARAQVAIDFRVPT